jgi:hypothetical protein
MMGYKVVYDPTFDITTTSFNQYVIAMKNDGVKILFLEQMPQNYAARWSRPSTNRTSIPVLVLGGSTYSEELVPDSGGAAAIDGAYMEQNTSLFLGEDAAGPSGRQATFVTWVQKASPGFHADLYTLYGWLSAELFSQALQAGGPDPSRGSVLAALRKITSFSGGYLVGPANPAGRSRPTATSSPPSPTGSTSGWTTHPSTGRPTATGAISRSTTPSPEPVGPGR